MVRHPIGRTGAHYLVPDTTGIDVGDIAEKAELLGSGIPDLLHRAVQPTYDVRDPEKRNAPPITSWRAQANTTIFSPSDAYSEIYVMHGRRRRRLLRPEAGEEKDSNRPLKPVIDKMNALAQDYYNNRARFTAPKQGS